MPRIAKPFPYRDGWYTDAGGVRTKLADANASSKDVRDAMRQHMDQLAENNGNAYKNVTVAELVALVLEHRYKIGTEVYDQVRRHLMRFVSRCTKRAKDVTPLDAKAHKAWLLQRKDWSGNYVNQAIRYLRTCWNWGADNEVLPMARNPWRQVPLEPENQRERIVTDDEFRLLLGGSDAPFRQVLWCERLMPLRPEDVRTLRWKGENEADLINGMWIIRRYKSIERMKKPKPKILKMPLLVANLLAWRKERYGHLSPFVFLNEDDMPWTKSALVQRMSRLRKRVGIGEDANGEQLVMYSNRHTVFTNSAMVMQPVELQAFANHTSFRTTERYVHLANAIKAQAADKAVEVLKLKRRSRAGVS